MKILLGHTFYQQKGGEDTVFEAEYDRLVSNGYEVVRFTKSNSEMDAMGRGEQIRTTFRNDRVCAELAEVIKREKPDVAHFHNTFQFMSAGVYGVCQDHGVPVVQTLHNYRLLCPNALFFTQNQVCERCLGKRMKWPAVRFGCYRESKAASLVVAEMLRRNWSSRTYQDQIHRVIALTNFAKQKFVSGGLSGSKISVKANFLADDPGFTKESGPYALFVGRLSEEKGLRALVAAWSELDIPLKIVGKGPLEAELSSIQTKNVEILGAQSREQVVAIMRGAKFQVVPSLWYEGQPMVMIEALAHGLPLVVSNLGALPEIAGLGGITFEAGNTQALRKAVLDMNDSDLATRRQQSRAHFEANFTAAAHDQAIRKIYESVARGG